MNRVKALFFINIIILFTFISSAKALEIIRDTERGAGRRDRVSGEERKVRGLLFWQRDTLKGGVGEAGS